MTIRVRVEPDGSLRLPAQLMERHGLAAGNDVVVDETSNGIVIRSHADVVRHVQEWTRKVMADAGASDYTVDDFIAERRREALREEREALREEE